MQATRKTSIGETHETLLGGDLAMSHIEKQASTDQATQDFARLLHDLARPDALPETTLSGEALSVIQTHASAVILAGNTVYKLKKPKDFGFFDYSTPALRRHFCQQEIYLNRRLAPDVYLGIAPVWRAVDGLVGFGATLPPEDIPEPGASWDSGKVVDYAVVMTRLPDDAALESLVRSGAATPQLLADVAERLAAFHASMPSTAAIAAFGDLAIISQNWEENFAQTRPYLGQVLDAETFEQIATSVRRFLQTRQRLFVSRVRNGRIRDCHGDLRLQHVYVLGRNPDGSHRLAVIDAIEFNERFRYGDVAGEIAFLTMELDAAGRSDLARAFVDAYVRASGDTALPELLPFYACYRAYVRGKVAAFQLDEPEVPAAQREAAIEQAKMLFRRAAHYASGLKQQRLLLVGGVMGTGKSTLAAALQHETGWMLCSSDATRKRLTGHAPAEPQAEGFEQGMYNPDWTRRTYEALLDEARAALAEGRSVLLDASFARRADRQAAIHLATQQGAHPFFIECICPPGVALQRLAQRWATRVAGEALTRAEASLASDGRPELYEQQRAHWEAFSAEQEPGLTHLPLETTGMLAASLEHVLQALELPRFACWL
jgi:aminoglycoside phosphotransferase family enzyme/predicted kinase